MTRPGAPTYLENTAQTSHYYSNCLPSIFRMSSPTTRGEFTYPRQVNMPAESGTNYPKRLQVLRGTIGESASKQIMKINNVWVGHFDPKNRFVHWKMLQLSRSVFFSNLNKLFMGKNHPYFFAIKIINFRVDLTNISARTATLVNTASISAKRTHWEPWWHLCVQNWNIGNYFTAFSKQ